MTTSSKQQPADRNPWAQLAADLAAARKGILSAHQDAQTLARHAPMGTDTRLARSLVGRKQAESASTIASELHRWELLVRNEAARLDLQGRA